MKKFGIYLVLFVLVPLLLVVLFFNTPAALFLNGAAPVFQLVDKASKIQTHTLLLGDSVCREFFEKVQNEQVYCLCENQSYEVAGNYLLLKKLLENGSQFKKVQLLINPRTLRSSLNQKYTYNYFIKPFRSHLDELDTKDQKYIKEMFLEKDILKFRFSNFDLPNAYDIYENNFEDLFQISDINQRYIRKIESLCEANNIDFNLLCPPLPHSSKGYLENFSDATKQEFGSYFESVIFYEAEQSKDGLHHVNSEGFISANKTQLDTLLKN